MKRIAVLIMCLALFGCVTTLGGSRTFTETRNVDGLRVVLAPSYGTFYAVTVSNDTGGVVKLIWDDSAYVYTSGRSCRLIRGETRKIHTGLAQPASPIPPGASMTELFIPEGMTDNAGAWGVYPENPNRPAQVHLTFEVAGDRKVWSSDITFMPAKK